MMRRSALAICLAVCWASCADAQEACKAFKWPVVREVSLLAGMVPLAKSGSTVNAAAFRFELKPMQQVDFPVPPERQPKVPHTNGGWVKVQITTTGVWQIGLSSEAWLDLVQDGGLLKSIAFSGKEGCPQLRKTVRFNLRSGPATLQISGSTSTVVGVALSQALP